MDCSPPGSSAHGISQTRILEWAATPFCSRSSQPRFRTLFSCNGRWILHDWALWEALMVVCLPYFSTIFSTISILREQAVSCSSLCYPYGIRAPCWQQTGGSASWTECRMALWCCTKRILSFYRAPFNLAWNICIHEGKIPEKCPWTNQMPFSSSWGDLCSRRVCMEDFVKRRRNILWIYDKTQMFNRSFKQYSQEYA